MNKFAALALSSALLATVASPAHSQLRTASTTYSTQPWYKQVTNPSGDIMSSAITMTTPSLEGTMANLANGHLFLQLQNVELGVGGTVGLNPGSIIIVHGPPSTGRYHVRFAFGANGQSSAVSIYGVTSSTPVANCTITASSPNCEVVFYYVQSTSNVVLSARVQTGYPTFASVYAAPSTYSYTP